MKINSLVLLASGAAAIVLSILFSRSETLLRTWTVEDGLIEYLSALFWLAGTVFCIIYARRAVRTLRGLFVFLALFMFLCFGEEISWGQRLFGYSVHAVESSSHQEEFNLHNLKFFSKDSFYDDLRDGRMNPLLLFNTQNLFRLTFLILFGVLPILLWTGRPKAWRKALRDNPPFPVYLASAWIVHLYVWGTRFLMDGKARELMNEVEELWSALFAGLFVWTILEIRRRQPTEKTG
ncbi:MAG TPA: hypothetical protein ENN17_08325 [bacterium]|nr:hypothetical protein [bacterium]